MPAAGTTTARYFRNSRGSRDSGSLLEKKRSKESVWMAALRPRKLLSIPRTVPRSMEKFFKLQAIAAVSRKVPELAPTKPRKQMSTRSQVEHFPPARVARVYIPR